MATECLCGASLATEGELESHVLSLQWYSPEEHRAREIHDDVIDDPKSAEGPSELLAALIVLLRDQRSQLTKMQKRLASVERYAETEYRQSRRNER